MYAKFVIWHRYKFFSQTSRLADNEKICTAICRKLINHENSKFLIAPLSGKRYIKNVVLGLFIVLDDRKISITNHVYHYDVVLSQRDWDKLVVSYDNKTEKIRNGKNKMISISYIDDESDDVLVPPTIPYDYWHPFYNI